MNTEWIWNLGAILFIYFFFKYTLLQILLVLAFSATVHLTQNKDNFLSSRVTREKNVNVHQRGLKTQTSLGKDWVANILIFFLEVMRISENGTFSNALPQDPKDLFP